MPVPSHKSASIVVAIVLVGGGAVAALQVRHVLYQARGETTVLFSHGLKPIVTGAPAHWTNQWCGTCRQDEFEEWSRSQHRIGGTNQNFAVECLDVDSGRQQYCLNCHAPRAPGENRLPTEEPPGLNHHFDQPPDWLADGVDCLSCHVRDGVVLATTVSEKGTAKHPMRREPLLGQAEFCVGCHQFAFKDVDLPDRFHGALQQASLEEFLEYREAGGTETRCHDCHLPGGKHLMPGGYDDEMVRQAVEMDVAGRWIDPGRVAELVVTLRTGAVGHRVPGGEELRFLTVKTEFVDQKGKPVGRVKTDEPSEVSTAWPQIETLRRFMGEREHGRDYRAPPAEDTRLRPGETRTYTYHVRLEKVPSSGDTLKVRSQLWYHLMHDGKAKLFGHAPDDVQRVVREVEHTLPIPTARGR